ncbi:CHAT domain-containing tetratricopeptide repeat protein [Nostoc sp. CMAA1605]|uniref:CHAT domain-containing tetratricopeptide repeat protein n=1 Tax=Nostoc sp. CMAA1605 TaxID=2055159 RepID=UPI001F88A9C8|nr:CHAT domain-containing tetratricopeptide repeat protein [Nostoc sp. CMAA1605]MCF4967770.1 Fis family transcriptional regulator [Nostoc sp. CMAA1605]
MRSPKPYLTAITLILVISGAIANLPILFSTPQVLAQTPQDRKAEADRLFQQGIEQYQTSQFEAALQSWQQVLIIYREIKTRLGEGATLGNLGLAYYALGDYSKAIDYHQQSLVIAQEIKDRNGEGAALGNLGIAYYALGDYSKAIDYHQQSLVIAREIKDRLGEGQSLGNLGIAYYALGDYSKAIDYHQQRLVIAREIKDRLGEGQSLGNLGIAYDALGDYSKAIDYHQQSLAIAQEIKDRNGEGAALGNLGIAYYALGNYSKAIDYQQQRLAIAREIKDRLGEGQALGNLGLAYNALGDYGKAIDYHQQRLAIAREIKDRNGEGKALGNLGIVYDALGDYSKAIDYQQQRLAIAREIKDRLGEGQSLGNLGLAYYALGDYSKAIDYHQQRLAIAREIKDRLGEGKALGNLGIAYYALGDYSKAIDYHQQSLAIAREIKDRNGEGQALGNLGLAYYALGDYSKAIDYHQQSLAIAREIKDRLGEGQSLGNLGIVYDALGDYSKAIDYHQQRLAITREIKDRNGEGTALNNLGVALQKSGKLPEAEKILRAGIDVWKSIRGNLGSNDVYKVSIFEEQARTYRTLQQVLIAQNKTNAALEISEQGRSRALVDLLNSRLSGKNTLENLEPTLSLLQQIAKQQNATLVEYSIIYNEFKIQGKQQTKDSELYIWVIKPTGEVTFRKADLKPLWQKENTNLEKLVSMSRQSIGVRGRGGLSVSPKPDAPKTKQRLSRLHQLLIQPIADVLPKQDSEKVIFIPQNELFLVPFPALQDERGKYLIQKHTILTSPSIQVLESTHKQRQRLGTKPIQGKDTLIVGNPTMPFFTPKIGETPQQLTPLPGAEIEAIAISKLLKTEPLIGNKATESNVVKRLPQARFVHLATHGIFDDIQGLNSAIALTPSGQDDGLLTASEILDLKLNAELVVLSACDTGRGRISGDGVIGLSRSLISAGVPSVLVSLWAVPDAPTARLMTQFYQNLQKNPNKAQALRQAMLTTMKTNPNPVDWAAFTLIGEAE